MIAQMKNTICSFLILLAGAPCFAQNADPGTISDSAGREKLKAAHAAYISERLELTAAEAEKFWPLYREYIEKKKALRQQYHQVKRNGHDGKDLLDLDLKIKQEELDLQRSYTPRFQEIISAERLIKLREAEVDFRKLVLRHIQQRRNR
jgi:hypothetical protein